MKSAGVSKGFGANGNPAATQTKEVAKEVTVIPPTEYQERFVRALDGYFTVCPGAYCFYRPRLITDARDR